MPKRLQHKHGALQWVFIYFKALLYNDIYKEYAAERTQKPTSVRCLKLVDDYSFLPDLYKYFGDIHQYWPEADGHPDFDNMFAFWQKDNGDKLMLSLLGIKPYRLVHAGEEISPEPYDVIYAIPDDYNIQAFKDQYGEILDRAHSKLDQDWIEHLPLPLYRTDMIGGENYSGDSKSGFHGKIFATEQRVDAYIWKHKMGMKLKDCVKQAAQSGKRCWAKIITEWTEIAEAEGTEISKLNLDVTSTEIKKMSKLAFEGKQVVENIVLGTFPSYK